MSVTLPQLSGTGYVQYASVVGDPSDVHIALQLYASSKTGLVLLLSSPTNASTLALVLVQGQLHVQWTLGDSNQSAK